MRAWEAASKLSLLADRCADTPSTPNHSEMEDQEMRNGTLEDKPCRHSLHYEDTSTALIPVARQEQLLLHML